jgi:hypothetical protein
MCGLQEELEGQRSDSEGEASGEGKQLQRLLKETKEGDEDEEEEEEDDEDEEVGVFPARLGSQLEFWV